MPDFTTTLSPPQQRADYYYDRWDFIVRSFEGDEFMLETVHKGRQSVDTELAAIRRIGRNADVYRIDRQDRLLTLVEILRPPYRFEVR